MTLTHYAHQCLFVTDGDDNAPAFIYPGVASGGSIPYGWVLAKTIDTERTLVSVAANIDADEAEMHILANGAEYIQGAVVMKFRIRRDKRYPYGDELYPWAFGDTRASNLELKKGDEIYFQGLTASVAAAFTVNIEITFDDKPPIGSPLTPRTIGDRFWYARIISSADAAAGAQWTYTAPVRSQWKECYLKATLVTDANVATRMVYITWTSGGVTVIAKISGGVNQTASTTTHYEWLPNSGARSNDSNLHAWALSPSCEVITGKTTIVSSIENGQGGDNWGVAVLVVLERVNEAYANITDAS